MELPRPSVESVTSSPSPTPPESRNDGPSSSRRLLFLSRPPTTSEGELDDERVEEWVEALSQVLWPQIEAARERIESGPETADGHTT